MGCASGTMKCILQFINTLIVLGAIILFGVAIYYFKSLPTLFLCYLFFSASLSLFIAILGCCGICKEHVGMTKAYAVLLLVSLLVQLIGKFVISDIKASEKLVENAVQEQWGKELINAGAMDGIQQLYQCCGKDSFNDYYRIPRAIPNSCYYEKDPHKGQFKRGCLEAGKLFVEAAYGHTAGGEWGNLVMTLIMFAFACYLVMRFSKKQQRYNYH